MNRQIVLCDIDHVISNSFVRDYMITPTVVWDDYHAASIDDEPLHDVVALINTLALCGFRIICITARPAKWKPLTLRWMAKHGIQVHEILMRADEDYRPSVEMKLALAREHFGDDEGIRQSVAFLLEDRDDVAAAFRGVGITVLQVFGRQK